MTRTELQLQDRAFNFDELTELQEIKVFSLEQMLARPNELKPDMIFSISMEVNPDLAVISRNNYTVLDLLSDVGGLAEVLIFTSSLMVYILNY